MKHAVLYFNTERKQGKQCKEEAFLNVKNLLFE